MSSFLKVYNFFSGRDSVAVAGGEMEDRAN